jgi:acyl carrier protein
MHATRRFLAAFLLSLTSLIPEAFAEPNVPAGRVAFNVVGRNQVTCLTGPESGTAVAFGYMTAIDGISQSLSSNPNEISLPEFMRPARYIVVDALPRSPGGKLDDARLVENGAHETDEPSQRSGLEEKLARIWEEMLQVGPIGIGDDFFDLGGHSLLAVRLVAKMGATLGREIRCRDLYAFPTIRQLATSLAPPNSTDRAGPHALHESK